MAKTWSVKPPVSACCSLILRPVCFINSLSRMLRCLTHGGGNVLGGEAPKLIGDLCEQEL